LPGEPEIITERENKPNEYKKSKQRKNSTWSNIFETHEVHKATATLFNINLL
jgi:hypothetical protein